MLQFEPDFEQRSSLDNKGQAGLQKRRCPDSMCPDHVGAGAESIVGHGFYRTRFGTRRRYRCRACGRTFASTAGTPCYQLQHRRRQFDTVVVVRRLFGVAALYGQVLKTRRNDRVIKVERRLRLGPSWRFADALSNAEDSATLNTSFVERLNLTIRQGLAYLSRRARAQARSEESLASYHQSLARIRVITGTVPNRLATVTTREQLLAT